MPDETPGFGHNNGPAFDPEILKGLAVQADEFLKASQVWLRLDKIETEAHAGQLTDQIAGLRGLFKKIDDARKDAKKPHDEAGNSVQAAFTPILRKLTAATDALKPKLAAFAETKHRAAEEERQRAEAEARAQAQAAEAARRAAEESGNISAQVDAEEAAKAAAKAQKEAARTTKTRVKSGTGAGRTMALRTVKEVEITNINVVFMHYRARPEVAELLTRLATADVRAAGYDCGPQVPGIKVSERKVMA